MNDLSIDALIAAERALIAALDADDVVVIERTTTAYANALRHLSGAGTCAAAPELRGRIAEALRLADTARARVNLLVDRTRQRLALLSRAAGREPGIGYRRDGRMRA